LPDDQAEAGIFSLTCSQPANPKLDGFAGPDDVALVLHTSGTTSRPKIVPLTHANLCASAYNIRQTLALTSADRCLNVMPLFHIHGLVGVLLSSLSAGASVICSPGFDAVEFFEWVETCQPSWYSAVPTIHQAILEQAKANCAIANPCRFRFIRSSSASLPRAVMAQLEDVFQAPVIEAYGMTEASHQMTSNPLPPRERKPGSVGIAAGLEVAIMDEAGVLAPAGQTGEIVIRGANVTAGYQNNPTANESAFTNGWFRTGDQGYMDEQGYLFISGRLKEIINRGGEKIAPREIDELFLSHPAVKQAVAFAAPHHTLGEDVAAAVILQPGHSISERELRAFAFEHLADYKVPSQVLIVDEIPKGPTGKLQRMGLADKLAHQLKANFVAARTPTEHVLRDIWQEVLEVKPVGIFDNFFGLGGDSLQATRLTARIQAIFNVTVSLKTIFKMPTIAEQATLIEELLRQEIESLTEEEARKLLE
jgi:acyl-CoA synthetase (AMP-forming)/AMP-acid ligase II/acyl carrier protein